MQRGAWLLRVKKERKRNTAVPMLKCGPGGWRTKTGLPETGAGRLKQLSSDAVRWPVLTRPPMAGFEVTTEAYPSRLPQVVML